MTRPVGFPWLKSHVHFTFKVYMQGFFRKIFPYPNNYRALITALRYFTAVSHCARQYLKFVYAMPATFVYITTSGRTPEALTVFFHSQKSTLHFFIAAQLAFQSREDRQKQLSTIWKLFATEVLPDKEWRQTHSRFKSFLLFPGAIV